MRSFSAALAPPLLLLLLGSASSEDCPISSALETGYVLESELEEASGMVASRINPGVFYSHNDHGDEDARIFAYLDNGESIAQVYLEGAVSFDYEDITIGPGPEPGVNYIYLGDIGNNDYGEDTSRVSMQIYRFPEPDLTDSFMDTVTIPASDIVRLDVSTPFLTQEDQETLMSDPVTGALYIITKNHDAPSANVYKWDNVPAVPEPNTVYQLPLVANIAYEMLVAGDISMDGSRILLRRAHNEGAYMWSRNVASGQTVEEALTSSAPCDLDLVDEEQGEAIAVAVTLDSFYTTSEGSNQPIYKYTFFAK